MQLLALATRPGGARAPDGTHTALASPRRAAMAMAAAAAALPIQKHRVPLVRTITGTAVTVVAGDTGCGKSTQLPQMIIDADPTARVMVTQPRRIAAISIAKRVAAERGELLGKSIGYRVAGKRSDNKEDTVRCTFVTTGYLLQMLVHHAEDVTDHVTHVVLDEAHERTMEMDLMARPLARPRPPVVRAAAAIPVGGGTRTQQ